MQTMQTRSHTLETYDIGGSIEPVDTLIARVLRIPEELVSDALEYRSIAQWDSLTHVNLMLAIEETYGLPIDSDLIVTLSSVAAIRAHVQQQLPPRRQSAPPRPSRQSSPPREPDSGARSAAPARPAERRDSAEPAQVHRGLAGVVFDRTHTTLIDGRNGTLLYRGYSIHDLAERSTFEETAYLLLYGALPTRAELAGFDRALKAARAVPAPVIETVRAIQSAHPTEVLRTAVSALAAFDPDRHDSSPEALRRMSMRLLAQVPVLLATHHALRQGRRPVAPHPTLPHAANLLYMLSGELPDERTARLIDQDLILHADHGSNASAFAARVVAGTRSDLYAAVTAAIATFAGPLHGGAVEQVMQMVQEIGEPERAAAYVAERLANNQPVMGFGHRVYQTEDPRARHLRALARELSASVGAPKWYAILEEVVAAMRPYALKGVDVNVDFYAGVIYQLIGIPQDLSVALFIAGRMPGWIAQVQEQYENNILIRPLLQYVGEINRTYTPLEQRG